MKKIIGFILLVIFNHAVCADTMYQVEIIAFARNTSDAESEENWDRQYDLRYPERYTNLQAAGSSNALFQQLPTDMMQLNREADAIAARHGWKILTHVAWRQTADDPAHATAVIISGGKAFGNHHELEGSFTLSVEHFLKADANLWLSRFVEANTATNTINLPNIPGMVAATNETNPMIATQTVVLQEQRRLRSGELHYLDHPRLGLIVLVTPVAAPQ